MKLIIAEKASLARAIAAAIGSGQKDGPFIRCGEYIVAHAHGHLLTLKDFDDYFDKKVKWGEKLPFYPDPFEFKIKKDEGDKKLFASLSRLANDPKVNEIICAGDADREGEVIIRLILRYGLKNQNKRITRLWLPDQTEQTITKELANRKVVSEYDNLYNEGLSRTFVDWLYGINLTRSISSKAKTLVPIGRVLCPIVMAIYDREKEIKDFVVKPYLVLESNLNGIRITSKQKYEKEEYEKLIQLAKLWNTSKAKVLEVSKKDKNIARPKLFSLSKLQSACGSQYKMKPSETLAIVQSLYEKGLVTYPRTNTEYLSENEKEKAKAILEIHDKENHCKFSDTKRIFDNTKIESHSAITPTIKTADLEGREAQVYALILNRFLAAFWGEECRVSETKVTVAIGTQYQEKITLTGVIELSRGWKQIEKENSKDVILPDLKVGQILDTNFKPVEKQTQPPKSYTVETLSNWMINPFRKETDTEDDEYNAILKGCEIGTEATRAGIIEKAIKYGYISFNKNKYGIEEKGIYMVETLRALNLDMSAKRTVELQMKLKEVYQGKESIKGIVMYAKDFLSQYFNQSTEQVNQYVQKAESIGCCPWCGHDLIKMQSKYGVFYAHDSDQRKKCSFSLNSVLKIYNQDIKASEANVRRLLLLKPIKAELVSKSGNPYKVQIKLKQAPREYNGKKYPDFTVDLDSNKKK